MKKVNTLRELQLISIYIYKDLLKVCNQNNIKLYLLGGSLIGAVRHGGYIPWDDDIDVCMSRPDYNKLLRITGGVISDKCRIIDPYRNKEYKGVVPVAVYENSFLESKQFKDDENLKISISIFVYDGAPDGLLPTIYYYFVLYMLRAKHALCRADFKHVNTKPAKLFGPVLSCFFDKGSVYKYKDKILNWQQKYKYEDCELVSTNMDSYSHREVFPKKSFEESIEIDFEGIKSNIFRNYHDQLTKYYGNYMQLPAIEDQKPKHSFNAEIEDSFDYSFLSKI